MDSHDLKRISVISGLGGGSGGLWRPVAACDGLWQQAVATIYYHPQAFRLAGWLDGWMEGRLDGRMDVVGITTVSKHARRLEGSADLYYLCVQALFSPSPS